MINFDESQCAVIVKQGNKYFVYLKLAKNSNPSKVTDVPERTTIFYGKKIIESSKIVSHLGSEIEKKRDKDIQKFGFYFISCLDMWGGDI